MTTSNDERELCTDDDAGDLEIPASPRTAVTSVRRRRRPGEARLQTIPPLSGRGPTAPRPATDAARPSR